MNKSEQSKTSRAVCHNHGISTTPLDTKSICQIDKGTSQPGHWVMTNEDCFIYDYEGNQTDVWGQNTSHQKEEESFSQKDFNFIDENKDNHQVKEDTFSEEKIDDQFEKAQKVKASQSHINQDFDKRILVIAEDLSEVGNQVNDNSKKMVSIETKIDSLDQKLDRLINQAMVKHNVQSRPVYSTSSYKQDHLHFSSMYSFFYCGLLGFS